ncbi:MAG: SDR family NAD(P)-dependent oxidoreductase [Myxococcales bacterium]|nr:SDR family NAD(P)-dependent oxidoreductase [Myxococcales bacterium]
MTTVLITGANAGLGKDAARQLALRPEIERVYLGCRTEAKALAAQQELEQATGREVFSFVHVDTSDLSTIEAAIASLEPLDGIILNAGGPGGPDAGTLTDDGVTQAYAANVLGHAALVEGLLAAGKLRGTVVNVSSEAVRGIPAMGMKRPDLPDSSVEDFVSVADGSRFDSFDPMVAYAFNKHVSTLWTSAMARRHPDVRFVSVSPGATSGTNAANELGAFQRFLFTRVFFPLFRLFGRAHGLEQGAERYVDALTEDRYESGRFYASPWPSTSGALVDQAQIWEDLANEAFQDNAYASLRRFLPANLSAA